jgi:hypothetical protein
MPLDRSFVELNRASSRRMHEMAMRLSDEELRWPVGKWTTSTTLAHLAFWDLRVMHILEATERERKVCAPEIDVAVNDVMYLLLYAIPPRLAAQMAFQTAEALDEMLERFPPDLLEQVYARFDRWVFRSLHRNAHLDSIETALKG